MKIARSGWLATTIALLLALSLSSAPASAGSDSEIVSFNKQSLKYHCVTCKWAKKCTENCVKIKKSEAKARNGEPCKVCKGSCG